MSGPVDGTFAEPGSPSGTTIEVSAGREATVGELTVRRLLPRRLRRTVGAWCFADLMGPVELTGARGVDIGPHPHIGLHTVTWLVEGELLHRDSLGSEQRIAPGQLNLMTAGHGVAHAEEGTPGYRGSMLGAQLWVAQPEETRHGAPAFEHHADLPVVDLGAGRATVLVGELAGAVSPARADTPLVGVEGDLDPGATEWPLRPDFEYAVLVLRGAVAVEERLVVPGELAYLGTGRDAIVLAATEPARLLLLGGTPFGETLLMWWNYVGRTRAEIDAAAASWNADDGRFGRVDSRLARIPSPVPLWRPGG